MFGRSLLHNFKANQLDLCSQYILYLKEVTICNLHLEVDSDSLVCYVGLMGF